VKTTARAILHLVSKPERRYFRTNDLARGVTRAE
jgi:hypothetical protein